MVADRAAHWQGGRAYTADGYVMLHTPGRRIMEHRYVMEKHLGRPLERHEEVHHINGIKDDNRLENLQVLTNVEHAKITHRLVGRWTKRYAACRDCGRSDVKHNGRGYCSRCYRVRFGH
jgi:predicted Zn-ribbon and HTH transcriptional regulator